ncbi:hypothetical protein NDU88_002518 [Pleurodeles waltl]|uniref:Uncharacterized protein n=1 Tax=Pleurodeles waltl TaxID=8319 RepID=A0AAV7VAR7_PLEWA|nr:hypothetical protein NDU88_002518 [Pleurodeles waltl]
MQRASRRATRNTKLDDTENVHTAQEAGLAQLLQPELGVYSVDRHVRNAKNAQFRQPFNGREEEKLMEKCV